jgi:hypothetical protein
MKRLSGVVNQTLSRGMVYRCTRTAIIRNEPDDYRRCSKNHVPCVEKSAGPVLTTKAAFVPALRSGQETQSGNLAPFRTGRS